MSTWSSVGTAVLLVLVVVLALCLRIVQQYQRGVVFRFGRVLEHVREPGLRLLVPFADRMVKVSTQVVVLAVAPQGAITRDNVTVEVDAAVYFRVVDPVKAIVNVQDYTHAVSQVAQTSLRTIIGRADLDTLLSDRDRISAELKAVIDAPTEQPWGVRIELVELRDISLPESMKRSMSRQAEAERERRARVIAADGERQASEQLAAAAAAMAHTPGAMHLRLLQTVADVAVEKNSTLVMPFPVELLRFFGHPDPDAAAPSVAWDRAPGTASPARPAGGPRPDWFAPAEPNGSLGARAGSPTGAGPDGDR
jgi:regulator of protease activity HflC (stomatin/prohibitin superfamily)